MVSMPSSSARLCRGAKAETLAIADFTSAVMTTGHHPVSDDVNLRGRSYGARFTLPQSTQQMLDRLGTRGNLNPVSSGESALILDLRLCGLALPFDLRLPKATRRIIRQNVADLV